MNNFKIRNIICRAGMYGFLTFGGAYATTAHALMPVTDMPVFIQGSYADLNRMYEANASLMVDKIRNQMQGLYASMNIDALNNGIANMITRESRAKQEIQNIEQMERARPAQDACDTVTLSNNLMDAGCGMVNGVIAYAESRANLRKMQSGRGVEKCDASGCKFDPDKTPTAVDISEANQEIARNLVDACSAPGVDCTNTSLLITPPGKVLDAKEYKTAALINRISSGPLLVQPQTDPKLDKDTNAYKRARLADLQTSIRSESIKTVKDNAFIIKNGTITANDKREIGEVDALEIYMNQRLGSKSWLCDAAHVCPEGVSYVPPAELERRAIQMQAVQLYINMATYKSSMRIEMQLAELVQLKSQGK